MKQLKQPPTVLVVAFPVEERGRLARWLREHGYLVTTCPGPGHVPCAGMRRGCALADLADGVVLDLTLEDDILKGSIPGWQVLDVYLALGLGVVALVESGDVRSATLSDLVVPVSRSAGRTEIVEAVRDAVAGTRRVGPRGAARGVCE